MSKVRIILFLVLITFIVIMTILLVKKNGHKLPTTTVTGTGCWTGVGVQGCPSDQELKTTLASNINTTVCKPDGNGNWTCPDDILNRPLNGKKIKDYLNCVCYGNGVCNAGKCACNKDGNQGVDNSCAPAPPPPPPPPAVQNYKINRKAKPGTCKTNGHWQFECTQSDCNPATDKDCFSSEQDCINNGNQTKIAGSCFSCNDTCTNNSHCCSGTCVPLPSYSNPDYAVCKECDISELGYQCNNCIGASTLVQTTMGTKKLGELEAGDMIQTYNLQTQTIEPEKLLMVYSHGINEENHLLITTSSGKEIILSDEHRIYLENGNDVQAQELNVGDIIKTTNEGEEVVSIVTIQDVPLTPVVLQGNVITEGGIVVSCWSGTKENAVMIHNLLRMVLPEINNKPSKEIATILEELYTKFRESKKDLSIGPKILGEYGISISMDKLIESRA